MVESEVSIVATKYLEMWNEQYGVVRDRDIVKHTCCEAMADIVGWIEGDDPNESRAMAGCADFTRAQLLDLYQGLAPSASYFGYTPVTEYLNVTL